jgi:CheY-like chemotaxis protein
MRNNCDTDYRMRVLLAEDQPANRAIVEVMLSAIDVELTAVEDGAQAVDVFCRQDFDIVLMDIQMPVMDGLAAIRAIRRFEAERERFPTPILAVTANAMAEHAAQSRAAGADQHIPKPFVPEELLRNIVETVARHALLAQGPSRASA